MPDLRTRVRRAIENALPWFDRATEERWKTSFQRDIEASRAIRQHADREIVQHDRRWSQVLRDIPRRYERYDDAVRRP
jgi:hypothetical protein